VLGVGLLIVGNATIFLAHASGRGSGGSPSE